MPERLIPISKKQHDRLVALNAEQVAAQKQVFTYGAALLDAHDGLTPEQIRRTDCADGVYSLVLEVPATPAQDSTG